MAIFGRNKEEDFEDEEELIAEEERENRKFTKKLKDLKSANRKKRKEPPKPWGKRERYAILLILGVTVAIAAVLAITSQNGVTLNFGKPNFSFDFSKLNPFKEETIVIQKK